MSKIDHAIRTMNQLDRYDAGSRHAYFYATVAYRDRDNPTVILSICDGYIRVESSRTLPTNGWGDHAFAMRRAYDFLLLSGKHDARPTEKEE